MSSTQTGSVLVLNGPAAVGKTTVGREVAAATGGAGGACVHGDDLIRFVVREPDSDPAPGNSGGPDGSAGLGDIGHTLGAAATDVFLDSGYELVVFDYTFMTADAVEHFRQALRADARLCVLTLWAPMTTVRAREIGRPYSERLGTRVFESWQEMSGNLGQLGTVIDADHSLEEVVDAVKRELAASVHAHS